MEVVKGYKTEINGEYTFAGVLNEEIENLKGMWAPSTFKNCMSDYRVRILPHFNDRAIKYYTKEYCEKIVQEMAQDKDYTPGTARHYIHLIRIIFEAAERMGVTDDPLWGTSMDQEKKNNLAAVIKNSVKKLVKFFSVKQEYQIHDMLYRDPRQSGFLMGLLIMWITGARNLEAAAICYENVKIKGGKPCVEIINTYDEDTDRLKPGTKTTNGVRYFRFPGSSTISLWNVRSGWRKWLRRRKLYFLKAMRSSLLMRCPLPVLAQSI